MSEKINEAELVAKHGKLVRVDLEDGGVMLFKRPKRAQIVQINKKLDKQPDLALEHMVGFCRLACVHGRELYDQIADDEALIISGDDGIFVHLLRTARGNATVSICG